MKPNKIEEMINLPWFALVAPDGTVQPMTLAEDLPTCIAVCKLMHKSKMAKSLHELFMAGFDILPVRVTLQNPTP